MLAFFSRGRDYFFIKEEISGVRGIIMMNDALLILYLANAVFLINHEIDSGYWQEWKLFRIKGGVNIFLVLHFPLILLVLLGLLEVHKGTGAGYVYSMVLSITGICAFLIHGYFLRKGHEEFNTFMSKFILTMILIISAIQLALSLYLY